MKRIFVILLVSIMLFSLCSCFASDPKRDAWVCAQDIVKKSIKTPSTAKFCSYSEATITDLGDDNYRVEGYVDAQNTYGAVIRSNFDAHLTLTEDGYKNGWCDIYQ